ncbi:hypothetical protein [Amycolatopsis cihanbeyliensis]|uniref:Uncharacterized protein n=1 Tax=Amycolatopsis cihanbeyliensis TaxID=1128664 RepID=A0A542DMN1_AMYCI|nr:hypothetical protein [Amycolatopsis cihanbeyliensis]TQJ04245.1 hypothetical protein FB471_4028 [Amycolatopsis cihanbeyliensis]
MARTVPRNRPRSGAEDAGSVAEVRDRTGILAASLSGQRAPLATMEPDGPAETWPVAADHQPADWFEPVSRPRELGRAGVVAWAAGALMFVVLVSGVYGTGHDRDTPADASDGRAQPTTTTPAPVIEIPPKPTPVSRDAGADTEPSPKPAVEPKPAPRREPTPAARTEAERPVARSAPPPSSKEPSEEPREQVRIQIPSLQDFVDYHELSDFTGFAEFGDRGSRQTATLRADEPELRIFPEAFLPR